MTRVFVARRDHRRVQAAVDVPEHAQPALPVLLPNVFNADRGFHVHVREAIEPDPALAKVLGALCGVEFDRFQYTEIRGKWAAQLEWHGLHGDLDADVAEPDE